MAKKMKALVMKKNQSKEQEEFSSHRICLFDLLPVELLDMILRKSYILHVSKAESYRKTNADIIFALASVNLFWFQWITSGKFKRSLWRHLNVYYDEAKKTAAIFRNNRNYLMGNIQPNDEFLTMLLSVHCLKKEQVSFIERRKFDKDKNWQLLRIMRSADETECRNFIRCLHQTKQRNVAAVVEIGGVVLKAELLNFGSKQKKTSRAQPSLQERIQQLVKTLNVIFQDNMERNNEIMALIYQLEENISKFSILSSSVDKGNRIVLWIWCRSQDSLENLHEMYDSKKLEAILRDLLSSLSSRLDICKDIKLWIDGSYFQRNVCVRSIFDSCSFGAKLKIVGYPVVLGVTKLRNQIHVLCRSYGRSSRCISMFEDENPFRLQKKMEITKIYDPWDIVSSEKENCLYISDNEGRWKSCIWKIKESEDGGHQVTKWLKDINSKQPLTLSVSSDGQLLTSTREDDQSLSLLIYGPDAVLRLSIPLSKNFYGHYVDHAVETSKGNFIISHTWRLEYKEGQEENRILFGLSEFTRDGSFIRRSFSKDVNQDLDRRLYLCIDSYDQVILADRLNQRVILYDSDLKWNRFIIPTEEDDTKRQIFSPWRLCYDEEKKQLIIGEYFGGGGVYVYNLY